MQTKKPVGNLTVSDGAWVNSDATLRDAIRVMGDHNLGVLAVLKGSTPMGVLTERDVVRVLYEGVELDSPALNSASRAVISVNGSRSIGYALDLMMDNNLRRLVVVDGAGNFQGIVTQAIILKHIQSDFFSTSSKVADLIDEAKEIIFAAEADTITFALEKMVTSRISAVPILKGRRPVGIITERDILDLAREGVALSERVGDHMTSPVECAGYETSLAEVVGILKEKGINRVIITDQEGLAAGVLTNRDLLSHFREDYSAYLEKKLAHGKEVMNLLPEMMIELFDTGTEQLIVWSNDKAKSHYGPDIIDSSIFSLVPEKNWADIYDALLKFGRVEDVRFSIGGYVFEFSGFYIPMEKAGLKGRIQLIMRDITEEVVLATTDPLTRMYNRRYMNEYLAREITRSGRTGRSFAIAIADLDDFKEINDKHGHLTGDEVLKSVAGRFMVGLRQYDLVGRYGGEEFLIVTPEVPYEIAVEIFERIRSGIENHRIRISSGEDLQITVSIGSACFDQDGSKPEELIARADERLYTAKKGGKNRVVSS